MRSVSVSVTNGTDPVENAVVTLTNKTTSNEYSGRTGSAGGCTINNVPDGAYTVSATATDFTDYAGEFTVNDGSGRLNITLS